MVVRFTTPAHRLGSDMAPTDADAGHGLNVPSVIRSDKLATLNLSVVARRLGEAPVAWLKAHRADFSGVFGFGPSGAPGPR